MAQDNYSEVLVLPIHTSEDEERTLPVLRDSEGGLNGDLQRQVEEAIKEYPIQDAEWWQGGVAAILAVEKWILAQGDSMRLRQNRREEVTEIPSTKEQ